MTSPALMGASGAGFLKKRADGGPDHIVFLLLPKFSLTAFTSAVDPLRLANYTTGRTLYTWEVTTPDGLEVQASNNVKITPDRAAGELEAPDTVIVCSGVEGQFFRDDRVFNLLRRWATRGTHLGSVCTGSYILARAGLLNGYRCTVHWECLDGFSDEFPEVLCEGSLFQIDRDRFTCAGGTAASDLMLNEIAVQHGLEVAVAVSDQFLHERIRPGADAHRLPVQARVRVRHPKLLQAIQAMELFCEELLDRDDIASRIGVSPRQLERLFRRYLQTTPSRYYLRLRLNRAQRLLTTSTMPISEVAVACGFTSLSHFSKCYRQIFGRSPGEERGRRAKTRRPRNDTAPSATGDDGPETGNDESMIMAPEASVPHGSPGMEATPEPFSTMAPPAE